MITTGFESRVKVQQIIENQLPEFLLSESPKTVDFLKQYYISQEYQGGPIDIAENLDQYLNLNNLSPEVIAGSVSLQTGISASDSTVVVNSTKGFPKEYGLLKIDDEIITYTGVTTNTFTGCIRGFSGITSYRDELKPEELVFSSSTAQSHTSGTGVQNLSALFLKEFYRKIKYLIAPGFEDTDFVETLDVNNFLKQIKNFYQSKGTNDSFRILFNVLFGVSPKIINLEDFILKPSGAEFIRREILVTEVISGNPNNLVGQEIRSYDDTASGPVSEVEIITRNRKTYYKIQLFSGFDNETTIRGRFEVTPKTRVSDTVNIGDSTISVDSTIGFPESGTLVSGNNTITYTEKSVNQFFGCSGITSVITPSSMIRSDKLAYGYENGDPTKRVELRLTGVLSDIENRDDFKLLLKDDILSVKNLGEKIKNNNESNKEFVFNSWIYNTKSRYEILNFSSNQLELHEQPDKSSLKVGDSVDILDRNSENVVVSAAVVSSINGKDVSISKNITGVAPTRRLSIRKNYDYASSSGISLRYNNILANIQNTYNENDEFIYVASNSLPEYTVSKRISTTFFTISPSSNLDTIFQGFIETTGLYSIISFNNDVSFITGDSIIYSTSSAPISNLISGRTYYVQVLKDGIRRNRIRLYSSRSFIGSDNFIQFEVYRDASTHTFTLKQHYDKYLSAKKSLSKIPLVPNIQSGTDQKTRVGTIGKLINGVEILNYKSNDKIYYGPLEEVKIYNRGTGYDVINPPTISVANPVGLGTTALVQAVVRGNVKEVLVDPQDFNVERVLSVTLTGGNGSGAVFETVLSKQFRELEFNAAQVGLAQTGGIDVDNETIAFLNEHKLLDGEEIVYDPNGNQPLGVGTYQQSNANQDDFLVTGSVYYPKVINPKTVYLFKTREDFAAGINTVGFTTTNTGGIHKFRLFNSKNIISEIKVLDSGSGYENRVLRVNPSGISTSFDTITFKDHGLRDGDIVNYLYETSPIVGLSTDSQYYILKLDNDNFQLSYAGQVGVGVAKTDYNKRKYIKLETKGEGRQVFSYPEIQISVEAEYSGVSIGTITATPIVRGEIVDNYVYEGGTNYGSNILNFHKKPTVTIRNGTAAQLKPIVSSGRIVGVEVQNGGKYYNAAPDLVVNGTGSAAKLRAVVRNGSIIRVIILNQGVNYNRSNTSISVVPPGRNCVLDCFVRELTVNNISRFGDENFIDEGESLSYSVVGYSTVREGVSFIDPNPTTGHSGVIGWAYDGNPIYGPFGYSDPNNNNSPIKVLKTSYSASSENVYNRPGEDDFSLGYFVEDYSFDGEGDLDVHNGRFAKTPEYPNGIYAYFVGINTSLTANTLLPRFPYFVGDTFRSNPVFETLDQSFDFNNSQLIRNTFPYRVNQEYSDNDFIIESNELFNQITVVESASTGKIDSLNIVNPGINYKIGNSVVYANEGTTGGGASAEVIEIEGPEILSLQTTYDLFENSVVTWEDQNNVRIHTDGYHNLFSGDRVEISGISTFINGLNGSHIIQVSNPKTSLSRNIPSNVGIVTDIYVSFIDQIVGSGTTIGIGTEVLTVLNKFEDDGVLRVKRGVVSVAHTSSTLVNYYPNSFTIPLKTGYFNSTKKRKVFFNPKQTIGVGIDTGTQLSINYYVGETLKNVSVPIQSIYIPNHQFKNNERVLLSKLSGDGSLTVSESSGGSTFGLPSFGNSQYVYIINKSKDFIGIVTQVGLTTSTNGLFFTNNGSNSYQYSLETTTQEVTANSQRIKTSLSISTAHNLRNGDIVRIKVNPFLSIGIGNSSEVRVKYNPIYKKILIDTVGFTSDRVSLENSQINIPNHNLENGQKVFYDSVDAVIGGLSTGGYYVYRVDANNIKLAETYSDTVSNPPVTVSIGDTGGSQQELSLLNPKIESTKNNNLVFNVSDTSLSNYKFKFYYDKTLSNEFVSTGTTSTFSIVKEETIGISSAAKFTITYNDSLPTKLYYSFEENGVAVKPDTDVLDYSEIIYVDSVYDNEYSVFGVGATTFNISLNEIPEKLSYNQNECNTLKYFTSSTTASGPISKINILSEGSGYDKLPRISGLTTGTSNSVGSNAIIKAGTNSIGKLNEYRIVNEGFEYASDKTLRPQTEVPTYISLESSEKIIDINVIDGGKNYISAPELIIVNDYNSETIDSGLIRAIYRGTNITGVEIIDEPKGLESVSHSIFTLRNSNGVQVERILSYTNGIVECELTTPPINGFIVPPFAEGDFIFVEGLQKQSFTDALGNITSPGSGFNSTDNGFKFFRIVQYINSNPAILKYDIGEFTSNAGTPVTIQTTFNSIVNRKNYPIFEVVTTPSLFYLGEKIKVNNATSDLEVVSVDKNFIKVTGDYKVTGGDLLKGVISGNSAKVNDYVEFKNRYKIDYSNKKEYGWKDDVGRLNYDLQVLPDNDYYQNLSYTIKSSVVYDDMKDPVNKLVHPSGMKNFADTEFFSSAVVSIGVTQSLSPVLDFVSVKRVDVINNYDFAQDYDPTTDSSRYILLQNKKLTDYIECVTNRVLQIDDISGRFSSSEFNKSTFVDTIEYPITDFYSKFLVQVMDEEKRSTQVSEVIVMNNFRNTYTFNKASLYTDQELGTFGGDFGDAGDPVLRFNPNDPNNFNYNLKVYRESYNISPFNIGIGFTDIGFTRLSSKTETVGPISGIGKLGVTTSVFQANSNSIDTIYAFAHVLDTNTYDMNYFEIVGYYDGENTHIAEYYFDSRDVGGFSGNFIGTFGLSVSNNVLNLSFRNVNSNNNVLLKVKTIGIGSTSSGIGTFRFLVDDQIPGTERTARLDSQYSVSSGISTILTFDSTVDSTLKSIVRVGVGSTVAIHNVLICADQLRVNIQQYPFITVGDNTGIGTFSAEMVGSNVVVNFHPNASYSSDNVLVQSYNQFIYSDIDEFNIPDDFTYGTTIERISNAFYGSINEFGKDKLDFDLNYKRIPIFEKTFNPSNTNAVDYATGIFSINDHFFETGEELIYTPDSTLTNVLANPMGIGETIVSGKILTADVISGFSTITGIAVSTGISTSGTLIYGVGIPGGSEIIGINTDYTYFIGNVVSAGSSIITGIANTAAFTVGSGIYSGNNDSIGNIYAIGINSITVDSSVIGGNDRLYYSTDSNWALTINNVAFASTFRETYTTGITTTFVPEKVFAIRLSKDTLKITGTSGGSGVGFTFTSPGSGNRHRLGMKKKLEKSLITVDGVTQYPLTYTPLTFNFQYNDPIIGTGVTFISLSGISSIKPRDIMKVGEEYLNITNVGLSTLPTGPISGIGTYSVVEVTRGFVGSSATTHSDGDEVRIYKGSYNIAGNKIWFSQAPDGRGNNNRLDSSNLPLPKSTFNGRVYLRNDYTNNKIYDDISLQFNGIGRTFTVYREGENTTGLEAGSNLVFINDVFQTPDTVNNIGNNYTFSETATGISSVTFTGITRENTDDVIIVPYDINQNQIPRGGVVVSVGSTGGLGYAPLIGAIVRAEVDGSGTITNIVGVPTYGSAYSISTSSYNNTTGILEVTTSSNHPFDGRNNEVYLEGLEFSCDPVYSGITTTIFPDGSAGFVFPIVGIVSNTTFKVNVGTSTITHNYVGQGSAFPYYSKLTFGSGYNSIAGIGITDSTGNGANITASVGIGGSLAFTIVSGGSGYTDPVFEIDDPKYENLPVVGVSRLGFGATTATGIGLSITLEMGPSSRVGVGSTFFEVKSFQITKPGYSFQRGDVFKVVGLVTDGRLVDPLEELNFTVTETFTDSFASWQLGEFDYIDSIKLLQDGSRTRFPLYKNSQLLSFQKNNSNVTSSLIDFDSVLLIYLNGVMQEPGVSYIFEGGTTFRFLEAPQEDDKVDIFFYRGTRNVDSIEVNVNETIKPGDSLQLKKNDYLFGTVGQDSRIVSEIISSDTVETGIYLGDGIDDTNYKPIDWIKQKRDLLINDNPEYKIRDSLEGMVFPTSKIIRDFNLTDNEIFLDDAQLFNYEENESQIEISSVAALIISGKSDPVSVALTANVSVAGTISSISIMSGGSGYSPNSTFEVKIAPPIGGIGTVFKPEIKDRPGFLGIASDVIIGISTESIRIGQAVKAITNIIDTDVTVIGISSGSGGKVLLSEPAFNATTLLRTFDFGRYQQQSQATATVTSSHVGIVTLSNITNPGSGYTSTSVPSVISPLPGTEKELVSGIRFVQGFTGIITGITTNTGIGGNPLSITFHVSYDANSDIDSLLVNYPLYVFDTVVGNGITSIDGDDNSIVGIGTTFADNVYYIHSIERNNLSGIITCNILSTTDTTGIHTMPNDLCGRFSWGRLSGFTRGLSPIGIAVSGYTVNSGLTTFPTVQRRGYGLRDIGALRKDLG